jgi:iron complex transport system substrate-binding protein
MLRLSLCLLLIAVTLLTLPVLPARAQGDPFPRIVVDGTGRTVTVPSRPTTVAAVSDVTALAQIVEGEALRALPLPPLDAPAWDGVGLLVLPALYATAYPALVESAQAAGVPIFATTLLRSLDAYRAHVSALGRATGRDDRAAALLRRLDGRIAALQTRLGNTAPVRALVLTPEHYTFGQGALISDLIAAAGGVNVAAEAGYGDIRQLTDAEIRALAPQVILLTPAWTLQDRANAPVLPGVRLIALPFSPTQPADPAAALLALALALHPLETLR